MCVALTKASAGPAAPVCSSGCVPLGSVNIWLAGAGIPPGVLEGSVRHGDMTVQWR